MGDNTRKFNALIGTRYGLPEKKTYEQVLDLAKKNNLAKSRAQLLLVERGLVHTNNPEPLVKEKVVYKDRPPVEKVVYKEKIVYKDKPEDRITEHLSDELIGGNADKGQRPSDDKLTSPNKANPLLALDEKKSSNNSNVGSWIVGLSVLGVIIYGLIKS
ncbi:hypothetical protein ES708_33693 [subsurface metagenome]|jgi:hypothetical protein